MQNIQTSKTPLVSFIVTYYNIPIDMLRECIESIVNLSLKEEEREIILIDDGSDVVPLDELIDYRDQIIYLRQKNMGVSDARNKGIDICKGKYIQFVDADDCLIKSNYEQCLEKVKNNDPDMVLFRLSRDSVEVDSPEYFYGPVTGTDYMRHNNLCASACSYIFRKKLLVGLRFTSGILHEDEEFSPQLILRADTVFSTDNCAYYYRERMGSRLNSNDPDNQKKKLDDAEYVIFELDHLAATLPSAERIALQRRVAQLSMDHIYNVIMSTHSEKILDEYLDRLRKRGLFPLPDREYSLKYSYFRKMINTKLGKKILLRTLPLMKKEK
ncbi:MAG: glycosyltransferase family 2 protein [Lachnospiraceae bacterium]|nr:glycosyltransferase family 2 protein [Lachnospiraceae bacterium]